MLAVERKDCSSDVSGSLIGRFDRRWSVVSLCEKLERMGFSLSLRFQFPSWGIEEIPREVSSSHLFPSESILISILSLLLFFTPFFFLPSCPSESAALGYTGKAETLGNPKKKPARLKEKVIDKDEIDGIAV